MIVSKISPKAFRELVSADQFTSPTAGICPGYAQANLIILPAAIADDFAAYAKANPAPCPVLETTSIGVHHSNYLGQGSDILKAIPRYRIYRKGEFIEEVLDATPYWQQEMVCFLIGCSFSFEEALLAAGLPIRHIEQNCNVPMYITNIECTPSGVFTGPMVVSMRPMTPIQAKLAYEITARFPRVHGAPIHMGDPALIGINNLDQPDYGDAVSIHENEIPVFWPCGVTPQAAVTRLKLDIAISHAPGHMFVSDILNTTLADDLR